MYVLDKVRVFSHRTVKLFRSSAFWEGFCSAVFPWYGITLYDKRREQLREIKEELEWLLSKGAQAKGAQGIANDFRAVEGYLWTAMNEFERIYGDDPHKVFTKEPPSSEEIYKRFALLVDEYDKANIPCTCVNCHKKGYTSHFHAKDGVVRCGCGGICVPLKRGDGIHY